MEKPGPVGPGFFNGEPLSGDLYTGNSMNSNPETAFDDRATPCIGVCTLLPSGYCAGCRRSMSEIARWSEMSARERAELMRLLPSRPLPELG